jgi:hypothetical protein
MNLTRWLRQALAAALCCLFCSSALAATGTVVMVADPRVLPLARRLQQEIESLGLEVVLQTSSSSFIRSGSAPPVVATIHLAPLGGSDVDLTIADSRANKTVSYKLISTGGSSDPASELVATRTVELLRASLLQIASTSSETPGPEVSPPAHEEPIRRSPQHEATLALALGAAPLLSPPFDAGWQLYVASTWMPSRHFGLMAAALPPLAPLRFSDARGSIELFAQLYRLGGVIALGDEAAPLAVRAIFGAELDLLRSEGHAVAPYASASETRRSLSPFMGGALRLSLAPSVHVLTELTGALSLPKTTVRSAGEEVADFGRPLATIAIGMELTWPGSRD